MPAEEPRPGWKGRGADRRYAFIRDNPREFETAYTDTLGDLLLSMGGSFISAVPVATVLWRSGRPLSARQV